jgi:hypothetical protein
MNGGTVMADKRRVFETHGVTFTGESGDQLVGRCPFTGKEDKFYVNATTWLWDSKTAGVSGNVAKFLELIHAHQQRALTSEAIAALAKHRGLPVDAFTSWPIGWTGSEYTMLVRDVNGTAVDIRRYRLGGAVMSTAECETGLWGADLLPQKRGVPIYVCEGEWDAVAWNWLRELLKMPGVVVAVPGAGTFKTDWVAWFTGRTVHVMFDHDEAGIVGEQRVAKRLASRVQHLTFLHWPVGFPPGFDIRDWVTGNALNTRAPQSAWDTPKAWFRPHPRKTAKEREAEGAPSPGYGRRTTDAVGGPLSMESDNGHPVTRWKRSPTILDVERTFRKWLHLESTDPIRVMLATVVSQQIEGPPIWMFLVSPPGGAKTETLNSLNTFTDIYATSSLTVHSLISGANFKAGEDPSLIPRLDGKVMVIKDFTSILSMRDNDKDEIFGILRDAYDGHCGKVFGNGIERRYTSRFSILAAVTPRIYDLTSSHTSLGERFLKYMMGDNLSHHGEADIIRRAIGNINREPEMREELQDVVRQFLLRAVTVAALPTIDDTYQQQIIHLARWGARMRGSVSRDTYKNDIITSKPSAEVGSRLGIQLAKLGKSLALVNGHSTVGAEEYRILKKVMLDTIPQRNEDILRHMLMLSPSPDVTIPATAVATATRYPIATVTRVLQDMNVLDIVARTGTVHRFYWTVSDYIRAAIAGAALYTTEEEVNRVVPATFDRVRRVRRVKPRAMSPPIPKKVVGKLRLVRS